MQHQENMFSQGTKITGKNQLMQEFMHAKQEGQKYFYDCSRFGSTYKVGEEVLFPNPTLKK